MHLNSEDGTRWLVGRDGTFFFEASCAQIFISVLSVAVLFHLLYVTYLSEHWAYMGFDLLPVSVWEIILTYIVVICPAMLLPRRSRRRVILVFVVLYYLVYVPSEFCLLFASGELERNVLIQLVLGVGFGLVAWSFRLRVHSVKVFPTTWWVFVSGIVILCGLCLVLILSIGVENIEFVSFFEASGLRREREEAGLLRIFSLGYLISWVTYVVAPILIIIGLIQKRSFFIGLGFLMEVTIFAATTNKFALLTGPFIVVSWFIFRRDDGRMTVKYVSLGTVLLFAVTLVSNAAFGVPNWFEQILSFFVVRYFGYQGMSTVLYAKFAENNNYTYWSHVRGVSAIVDYPFDESVPWVLGSYWANKAGVSAPSHPWAQDGLLAAGLFGIIVISVIVALIFWVTDSMTARIRTDVLVPLLLIQGIMLSESSIFTQILSNGLALICFVACVAPRIFLVGNENSHAG